VASDPWPLIHAERTALLADLADVPSERWSTRSLCPEWTVHQVLGHMTATARMTPGRFVSHMAGAGFRFHRMNDKGVAAETAAGPLATLAAFGSLQDATTSPPGPTEAMLGEVVVHSQDIRRPLGIARDYPTESVVRVLDFFKGSNLLIGSKTRIAGVRLRATDADWSHGSGPEAAGPVASLALAMTGRVAGLDGLSGPGVDALRGRMA
jgi:uncharacterized protein (TIGR03083 family)